MKAIRDAWFSRKLWITLLLTALSTHFLWYGKITGREWCIFIGVVAGAYLYFQGSLDIHKLKISANTSGIILDNTEVDKK